MKPIIVLKGRTLWLSLLLVVGLIGGYYIYHSIDKTATTSSTSGAKKEFTIITTEYKSKTEDGKVIEVPLGSRNNSCGER